MQNEHLDYEEEEIRKAVRSLNNSENQYYQKKIYKLSRDPDTYATLNWFCISGLHHLYLKKYFRGAFNLFLMCFGLYKILSFGLFVLLILFLIELPALFYSQRIVKKYNIVTSRKILEEIRMRPMPSSIS
jgi:TM2 domain-containing membrane protein YozV